MLYSDDEEEWEYSDDEGEEDSLDYGVIETAPKELPQRTRENEEGSAPRPPIRLDKNETQRAEEEVEKEKRDHRIDDHNSNEREEEDNDSDMYEMEMEVSVLEDILEVYLREMCAVAFDGAGPRHVCTSKGMMQFAAEND